ncbi:MAG: response regulator [Gaiellaceae bacterium]|jgi:DNA-binding NtrC family response regulator
MERTSTNGDKTIVLVEDDDVVRRLVSRVLESAGYRVVGASSGEEGFELLTRTEEAELLLTDVTLPGDLNGLELGRRALEARAELKLVCMSGYGEEDMAAELLRMAGGAAFIGKPFSPGELVETVHNLLDAA